MNLSKISFIILIIVLSISCKKENEEEETSSNFRKDMRTFVINISKYAKSKNSSFIIIPQNGIDIIANPENINEVYYDYLSAIDGNGQEDLFYGYDNDNQETSSSTNNYLRKYLDISKQNSNTILVTDYCSGVNNINDSYMKNKNNSYISFAAPSRELDSIPAYPNPINNINDNSINHLSDIKNFLYIISPSKFGTKTAFIDSISTTNYDLIIMDAFFNDGTAFTNSEINALKTKANGGSRLVIAYMSIGEAEDYRFYWQESWNTTPPTWLDKENPDWAGNFKVKYWIKDWQNIIYGDNNSYINVILNAGFNGVYLDIIDAYEFFEN
jgi:cysteinyl-tRNA synthetase